MENSKDIEQLARVERLGELLVRLNALKLSQLTELIEEQKKNQMQQIMQMQAQGMLQGQQQEQPQEQGEPVGKVPTEREEVEKIKKRVDKIRDKVATQTGERGVGV